MILDKLKSQFMIMYLIYIIANLNLRLGCQLKSTFKISTKVNVKITIQHINPLCLISKIDEVVELMMTKNCQDIFLLTVAVKS